MRKSYFTFVWRQQTDQLFESRQRQLTEELFARSALLSKRAYTYNLAPCAVCWIWLRRLNQTLDHIIYCRYYIRQQFRWLQLTSEVVQFLWCRCYRCLRCEREFYNGNRKNREVFCKKMSTAVLYTKVCCLCSSNFLNCIAPMPLFPSSTIFLGKLCGLAKYKSLY